MTERDLAALLTDGFGRHDGVAFWRGGGLWGGSLWWGRWQAVGVCFLSGLESAGLEDPDWRRKESHWRPQESGNLRRMPS